MSARLGRVACDRDALVDKLLDGPLIEAEVGEHLMGVLAEPRSAPPRHGRRDHRSRPGVATIERLPSLVGDVDQAARRVELRVGEQVVDAC